MARLGRRERLFLAIKRAERSEEIAKIVRSNLTITAKAETSRGYGSDTTARAAGKIPHGLYRSGYDPDWSTLRQTNRGLKAPKPKSIKAAKAGPVRSL